MSTGGQVRWYRSWKETKIGENRVKSPVTGTGHATLGDAFRSTSRNPYSLIVRRVWLWHIMWNKWGQGQGRLLITMAMGPPGSSLSGWAVTESRTGALFRPTKETEHWNGSSGHLSTATGWWPGPRCSTVSQSHYEMATLVILILSLQLTSISASPPPH